MRERVRDRGRLEHIMNAINGILTDKELYTFEQLKNSTLIFYGFTKYVEVIGEAVYMLIEHPKHERYGTQAYVKDSLIRAIQEAKNAKFEGRILQTIDDFIKVI